MCDQLYWRGPLLIYRENAVKSSVPFSFKVFCNTYTCPNENLKVVQTPAWSSPSMLGYSKMDL